MDMEYEQYAYPKVTDGFQKTVAAFGIVSKESTLEPYEGQPVLLLKQRAGDGDFPFFFDLPGGVSETSDETLKETAQRELHEEVRIRSSYLFQIGSPMYEVRSQERRIIEYHLFAAIPHGPPKESREAINLCWVTPRSLLGLRVAGFEVRDQTISPMGIMIYDGFSILSKPLYEGPLTASIKAVSGSLSKDAFSLLDNGRYFGRLMEHGAIRVYRRLNPFQRDGYFRGALEHLDP
jgi:8-oxo-dGTP pyrophosphatase MutT (NUDIX family)